MLVTKLTAIADAIRGKTGKTESMTLAQMATEIAAIEAGGGGGAELIYETTFTIAETLTASATVATINTGLAASDFSAGDNLLWTITLVADNEPDTSISRFRGSFGWCALYNTNLYPSTISTAASSTDTVTVNVPLLYVKSISTACASVTITGTGAYAGYGKPVAGDYSLKLYRLPTLLEGVVFH